MPVSVELDIRRDRAMSIPPQWDYGKSVEKVRGLILRFNTVSAELLGELWVAREQLSKHGPRAQFVANATNTWTGYLHDVGLDRSTIHRWLEQYDHVEHRKKTQKEIEQQKEIKEIQRKVLEKARIQKQKVPQRTSDDRLIEEIDMALQREKASSGRLKLDGKIENLAQKDVFEYVQRYISALPESRRLEAVQNLIKWLKEIAISLHAKSAK